MSVVLKFKQNNEGPYIDEAIGGMFFKGSMDEVIKHIVPYIENGFSIVHHGSYLDWPRFWKRIYFVHLEVHYYFDQNEVVKIPSTEEILKQLQ